MYILQWRNKHSNETGFVKSISTKERHFVNTFDQSVAKQYSSRSVVDRTLATLNKYGETVQNDFNVIEV